MHQKRHHPALPAQALRVWYLHFPLLLSLGWWHGSSMHPACRTQSEPIPISSQAPQRSQIKCMSKKKSLFGYIEKLLRTINRVKNTNLPNLFLGTSTSAAFSLVIRGMFFFMDPKDVKPAKQQLGHRFNVLGVGLSSLLIPPQLLPHLPDCILCPGPAKFGVQLFFFLNLI